MYEVFSAVRGVLKGGFRDVASVFLVKGLPYIASPGMSAVDLFPRVAKVVVDLAGFCDVFAWALRVGNVGRRRDVVVSRTSKRPPPKVFFPVPLVESPVVVFSITDALPQGMLVFRFA